jgi:1,4-alpha-glucan branching enzyme
MIRAVLVFLVFPFLVHGQVTVSPAFPTADQEITITYDATKGTTGLVDAPRVFMHSGAILSGTTGTSWVNVKGTWGDPNSVGEMTSLGNNLWQIKITPRTYFGVAAGTRIFRIGMVFRSAGPCGGFPGNSTPCKEGKTSTNGDIFVDLFEGNQFQLTITEPSQFPVFRNAGELIHIAANASAASVMKIVVNGNEVASQAGVISISYDLTVGASGVVEVTANNGTETKSAQFNYIVRTETVPEPRPAGIVDGINYSSDNTRVTLSLWAPGKQSVYVTGDFNQWSILPSFQMKQSGEHFWLEIGGLTAGVEYAFQYLVDESIYIADPYADKILDPDDQYIPTSTYPGLKAYPSNALKSQWYFNRASVLQTAQAPYSWKVTTFQKPAKQQLVIYELLIRDFFDANNRNYNTLIDTLGYLQRLGVNAIELMPVTEFNGNDSWGYNPTFMFAPDKYYGSKNDLKRFIDTCHDKGIAVILDIVMNHQDIPNSYAMMDFDFTTFKPTSANKWFNVNATHPFSVFNDLNHESTYTKAYLDTVNHYWLSEYKVDGFRYDLSKGFTQRNNPTDVNAWSAYDASRIAILKRMADKIWSSFPDAYVILEHFAANDEEKELAEYRSDEGKGMMPWVKMTDQYNQNTMGYSDNSDISAIYYANRNWTVPRGIGYMESHDEERLMYKNLQYGASAGSYNVKDLNTSLERMRAACAMFYTIPGPKMLWEFGELGYDISINQCDDGSNNSNCRVNAKPLKWSYKNETAREILFDYVSDLIRLRKEYKVFSDGAAVFAGGTGLVKQVAIKNNPYTASPSDVSQMNAHVIANFDVTDANASIGFIHPGTWYNYYTGNSIQMTGSSLSVQLRPGEFLLFTDVPIKNKLVTGVEEPTSSIIFYPNPAQDRVWISGVDPERSYLVQVRSVTGELLMQTSMHGANMSVDVMNYPVGVYTLHIWDGLQGTYYKILKR